MRLASTLLLPLALVALSSCATTRFEPTAATGFQIMETPEGRFFAYVPADAADRSRRGEKLPIVLYLHGGEERGTDPDRPTQVGLGPYVAQSHGAFPYLVLFPQCPRGSFWAQPDQLARLTRILDYALPRIGGDPERVYVTGNSMGGYGSWLLAAEHPDRFAAIVPICGGVKPPRGVLVPKDSRFGNLADPHGAVAEALGKLAIWTFHGAKDWLVPPSETRAIVEALRARGNPARHTEYADLGHPSWDRAYADPELWRWLAAQRRGVSDPTQAPAKAAPPGPEGN